MKVEATVGPTVNSDGSLQSLRLDKQGGQVVSELAPRYFEQAYRGNSYLAANAGAQAVSVALATTYTGLVLSNPPSSSKMGILKTVSYALSVAPAAIAPLFLIGNKFGTEVTHTTPVASGIQNARLGDGIGTLKVDSAATLPVAPIYLMPLFGGFTAAALPSIGNTVVPIEGQILIPPGAFVAIGALTAVTGIGGFTWDEVPV